MSSDHRQSTDRSQQLPSQSSHPSTNCRGCWKRKRFYATADQARLVHTQSIYLSLSYPPAHQLPTTPVVADLEAIPYQAAHLDRETERAFVANPIGSERETPALSNPLLYHMPRSFLPPLRLTQSRKPLSNTTTACTSEQGEAAD